jgi:hypothetical protein
MEKLPLNNSNLLDKIDAKSNLILCSKSIENIEGLHYIEMWTAAMAFMIEMTHVKKFQI